ncbi:hypothetical protein IQ07DRAFT_540692 [Pyrenochaeta sp. DS3sAY3a]|nr:hypothetical protein IQ07DRAFT_540692 [Pyrenochaeta sp. DS3sAY3a]
MDQLDLIKTPLSWGVLLLGLALYVINRSVRWRASKASPQASLSDSKSKEPVYSEDDYYNIQPLHDFDLDNEEPLKVRPFKPKFHMTMAIENITLSDLIAMDNSYATRLQIRTSLLKTQHHEVLACNPAAAPAVLELYTWLTSTYLPTRFPSLFQLSTPNTLLNTVTGALLPLQPASAPQALEILGANIDDEFFILLPSSTPGSHGKYRLEAFINCFPSGFNTRSKLGALLAEIHTPVPHYKEKLEKSMDRFFAALPVGRIVRRFNWTVSTNGELFCLSGNHGVEEEGEKKKEEEEVDLRKTVLRCERQTLHRLPGSGAIVFAFKTYQYPIQELRDEGSGEMLAEAIDGMATGSVPRMTVYKRQVVWGPKVKAFLRGEIDI